MPENKFIVTFPLYLIVIPSKGLAPLVVVSEGDENYRAVAMFTEELFAERTRDAQTRDGEILTVPTLEHLKAVHLPLFKQWGFKYVAIDTHEHNGRGNYIPIEDLG